MKAIGQAFQKKPFDQDQKVIVFTNASKEGGLEYILAQEKGEINKETGLIEPKINQDTGQPMLYKTLPHWHSGYRSIF